MGNLRRKLIRPLLAAFAIATGALALVSLPSCASDKKDATVAPTPALTAQEALSRARGAMTSTPGFNFELTHPTGATSLPGGLFLTRATGSVLAPDRLSVTAEANFGRAFVRVSAIVIGADTYMTNFLTGAWSPVPAADSPFAFLDPIGLVTSLLGEVQDVSFAAPVAAGADLVIAGRMPAKPFAALVGTVDESKVISVRLTFDATTFVLKEVLAEGALQPGDGPTAARLITLSGYADTISIEKPV